MSDLVELDECGGVATLRLGMPDTLNAMTDEMGDQFYGLVQDLKRSDSVRVVVVTGQGRAFSAGGNLEMLRAKLDFEPEQNRKIMLDFYLKFLSVTELEVPVVAALNGHAVGAGLGLALGCDFRICSEKAKLGVNFVRLGLYPGMGTTKLLCDVVGYSTAMRLLLSGEIITAEEALGLGLVDQVVAADAFEKTLESFTKSFLQSAPETVKATKRGIRAAREQNLQAALQAESAAQSRSYASEEFKEGISAALEKRKPTFSS